MQAVSMPAIDLLSTIPQVLAVEAELHANCELAFARLWSWTARHGLGPHPVAAIERVVRWEGDGGVFVRALVSTGWADQSGVSVTIRPWQAVLGLSNAVAVGMPPADETPEQRRRRQKTEWMRLDRAAKKAGKVHPQSAASTDVVGGHSVVAGGQSVVNLWSNGGHSVVVGGQDCGQSVVICGQETAPSRARSLFSDSEEKNSEAEAEAEAEKSLVGVDAGASTAVAARPAHGGPTFSADSEAAGQPTLFALTAPATTARSTADGQERPALGSGATIDPEVRSVPVPASDRASEGSGGGRAKRGRGARKAAVDPQAVDGPVRQVWDAYAAVVGTRVVLSQERASLIAARLADGWTAEELVEAVRGFGKSAWHFGANDRNTRFTSIELWLRDAAHVEQGLGYHKEAAKAVAPRLKDHERMMNGIKQTVAPSLGGKSGISDKFDRAFAEQRRKEAEKAEREQA